MKEQIDANKNGSIGGETKEGNEVEKYSNFVLTSSIES